MALLTEEQLWLMGFKKLGTNLAISDKVTFYNVRNISIGDNTRIDDYAVISGGQGLIIGRYVHIATHVSILGGGRLELQDYTGLSAKVSVFTSEEPYDGSFMTNPTIPEELRNTHPTSACIGKHTVVGAGSVILAGRSIANNVAIGALSLVRYSIVDPNSIYAGNPIRRIRDRKTDLLNAEQDGLSRLLL